MNQKLVDLYFKNYIKGKIDFEGIILTPITSKSNKIMWDLDNPKDLSFTHYAIVGVIEDSINDFAQLLGQKRNGEFYQELLEQTDFSNIPTYYVSEDLDERLLNVARKIKSFSIGKFYKENITFSCQITDIYTRVYGEEIALHVDFVIHKATYDSNEEMPLSEFKKVMDEMYNTDKYLDFCTELLDPLSNLIWFEPAFCDKRGVYITEYPHFFSTSGQNLLK